LSIEPRGDRTPAAASVTVERNMDTQHPSGANDSASLGEQLAAIISDLPQDHLTLRELLDVFGDEGLLLLTMLLTLVFLIPVSIPGVSTVFGAAILLVGISRLFGRAQNLFNNLAFILAALLLMAPFGFVPFSNTLPALALLFFSAGLIQRDGVAVLLGHLANVGTIIYFGILIGGGSVAAHELFQRLTG
jgi:hypothetical protein